MFCLSHILPPMSEFACQFQYQRWTQLCLMLLPVAVRSLVGISLVQYLPATIFNHVIKHTIKFKIGMDIQLKTHLGDAST